MRVGIANRGEVAVRIIRACQELGFKSVLFHSTPDKNTAAFRLSDERIELTGNTPLETYLNISAVVQAAVDSKVKLVHPGFGFLSENAEFAEALAKRKIIFVGPTSPTISLAGNKINAKQLAKLAGVPVIPAYTGAETDPKKLLAEVRKIGFPCMVKAASGGGGKGMKVVHDDREFFELYSSAQREAKNAFGSEVVFIEKYIENPRHIEVQVVCDSLGNSLHFFERDCSIQRRHQKIFEETPSPSLTDELRREITTSALKIVKQAGYLNAGTVEFLVDKNGDFYFMELNTRLQVEHTVTEFVCGVDFVHLQFAVALGKTLPLVQDQISQRGHALEVRIYAENPAKEFLPSTGDISEMILPTGPYRRFDFGYDSGDKITPFYDPMIGKIITWAPTREENLKRMHSTLCETTIFGVHTNIEFLKSVIKSDRFISGQFNTSFLTEEFKDGYELPALSPSQQAYINKVKLGQPSQISMMGAPLRLSYQSPWLPAFSQETPEPISGKIINSEKTGRSKKIGSVLWVHFEGRTFSFEDTDGSGTQRRVSTTQDGVLRSPMPGKILKINFKIGDVVKQGQTICILEAMKMEYALKAPFDGKVVGMNKNMGAQVVLDEKIAEIAKGEK